MKGTRNAFALLTGKEEQSSPDARNWLVYANEKKEKMSRSEAPHQMKLDRGQKLYHKEPLSCDLSDD